MSEWLIRILIAVGSPVLVYGLKRALPWERREAKTKEYQHLLDLYKGMRDAGATLADLDEMRDSVLGASSNQPHGTETLTITDEDGSTHKARIATEEEAALLRERQLQIGKLCRAYGYMFLQSIWMIKQAKADPSMWELLRQTIPTHFVDFWMEYIRFSEVSIQIPDLGLEYLARQLGSPTSEMVRTLVEDMGFPADQVAEFAEDIRKRLKSLNPPDGPAPGKPRGM